MSTGRLVDTLGPGDWAEEMVKAFPKFAEGLARVGDLIHTDGALRASEKALCVAAICAVKRVPDTTARYLSLAVEGGLTVAAARGAAINVLISRGLPAYRAFTDALSTLGVDAAAPGPEFTEEVTEGDIVRYYRGLFGDVPPNVALGMEHAPTAVEGYYLMRRAALEESPLEPRLADVMLCAVNAAEIREDYVTIHARFALRGGATAAQLTEAVACSIPFAGVAAWLAGANGVIAALEGG